MTNASKVLYIIGKVVNVIEIVATGLALIFGVLVIIFGDRIIPDMPMFADMTVYATGTGFTVGGLVALAASIATLVFANYATKSLENGRVENAPHIIMIVVGVFGNIFYIIGGIFGLVAENTETEYSM